MERDNARAFAVAALAVLAMTAFATSRARPAEPVAYAVTLYAWEDAANTVWHSHTFATFERFQSGRLAERACISWGPVTRRIGVAVSTRGRNRSLEESLAEAKAAGLAVYAAGPFPCHPELFWRAKARVAQLESGRMRYVVLDGGHDRYAVNCIGAVCGVLPNPPRTGALHGRDATEVVVRHFRNYLIGGRP